MVNERIGFVSDRDRDGKLKDRIIRKPCFNSCTLLIFAYLKFYFLLYERSGYNRI